MAAKHSKLLSRKRSALELKSMSQAEVERATSSRMHAGFGVPGSAARDMLDGDELPVRIGIPHGPSDTLSCRENVAQGFGTRALSQMVSMVCCRREQHVKPHLTEQQPETEEGRVKNRV